MKQKTGSTHRRILIVSESGDYAQLLRHSLGFSSHGIDTSERVEHPLNYDVAFSVSEIDFSQRYHIVFADINIGWRYCYSLQFDTHCSHFYVMYDNENEIKELQEHLEKENIKKIKFLPKNPMDQMLRDVLKHDIFKKRRI